MPLAYSLGFILIAVMALPTVGAIGSNGTGVLDGQDLSSEFMTPESMMYSDTTQQHAPVDSLPVGIDEMQGELQGEIVDDVDEAEGLEIDGLLVDETRTKMGRDFYELFYASWTAPEGAIGFTLVVREQPMPQMGTRVLVEINDQVVYHAQLQPRYEMIEEHAEEAINYATYYLEEVGVQAPTY